MSFGVVVDRDKNRKWLLLLLLLPLPQYAAGASARYYQSCADRKTIRYVKLLLNSVHP
jgi:hypothetical protein